jgi:hypothetical protein
MKLKIKFIFGFLLISALALSNSVYAQQKFVRGQGNGKDKKEAMIAAKKSAWNDFKAKLEEAKLDNIIANEKMLLENLDDLMVDINVLSEECKDGCVTRIKATVNESIIDSKLRSIAKAGGKGGASSSASQSGGTVAMLTMARVIDKKTTYDDKVTKKKKSTESTSGTNSSSDSEDSSENSSSNSMTDTSSVTTSRKDVTSGKTVRKGAKLEYKVFSDVNDFQNTVSGILKTNNIKVALWANLIGKCKLPQSLKFSQIYAESSDGTIPDDVLGEISTKLQECGISKLIVSSISMDGTRTDPNGLMISTGNVNIAVYDLTSEFAESLGTANITAEGSADEELDAQRDALKKASKKTADSVVNQINQR